MKCLNVVDVMELHCKQQKVIGGGAGLLDRGALESAVASAYASFGGVERYRTIEAKAARLCFAIIMDHPFKDGNKRTGVLAMLLALRINGVRLEYTQQELATLGWQTASGQMGQGEILDWIVDHKVWR